VKSFCKIFEFKHLFFRMRYIREDWIPSYYYPDFVVKTSEKIYIVETKATKDINNENVRRKEASTISQLQKINDLPENLRENKTWEYVLLSEDKFYSLVKNNANIIEILENSKILDLKTKWNQVAIF
jgi:type III restriction enzyme